MSQPLEVEVWVGDWGLPSIDINCLQVMVYCRFSGVPLNTKVKNSPFRRTLPTFRHGKVKLHNLKDVAAYLKTKSFNTDHFLSAKNLSDVEAYGQLLQDKLYPALQFVWWLDNKNFVQLTRPWYANKLPFPFNFYYPGQYEGFAKNLMSFLYGSVEDDYTMVETQVYREAEKCLTLLSHKLGNSKYFFGTQPSSLDAIIFSYLAPLLKAPFPNPALQNHLKACTNLVAFVDNILEKYYSPIMKKYEEQKRELMKVEAEEKFPFRSIFAGFIAFTAMVGYIALAPVILGKNLTLQKFFYEPEEEVD